MKYRFLFALLLLAMLSVLPGRVIAQQLSLNEITDQLIGNWKFKRAEVVEKKMNEMAFGSSRSIDNVDVLKDYAGCYGDAIKNVLFMPDQLHLDAEALGNIYKQAEWRVFAIGSKTLMEITFNIGGEGKNDAHEPITIQYELTIEGAGILKLSYERYCQNQNGNMVQGVFTSILTKEE